MAAMVSAEYLQVVKFNATVQRDGDWFVARCLDIEVASQGRSPEAAVNNLREALELLLEEDDQVMPVPADPPVLVTIDVPVRLVR